MKAEVLGQLLLMQNVLISLPTNESIFSFVCGGLTDIPGVAEAKYSESVYEKESEDEFVLPVIAGDSFWGELILKIYNRKLFSQYSEYIDNFCYMIAIILEERDQRDKREELQKNLESLVEERTEQIKNEITKKLKFEKNLELTEKKYKAVVETSSNGFWITDDYGKILQVNVALCEMTGYSESELLTMKISDIDIEETEELVKEHIKAVKKTGDQNFEAKHRRKDGTVIDVEVSLHYINFGKEKIFAFIKDISERKVKEEELKREKDFTRKITETSPVGIIRLDQEGKIIFANKRAEEIMGLSLSNMKYDSPIFNIKDIDGNELPAEKLPFNLVKRNLKPYYDFQHIIQWSKGRIIHLSINIVPLLDKEGNFEGAVASIEDITERKKSENELAKSEERFRVLVENAPEAIAVMDIDTGKFIDINKNTENLYKLDRDKLLKTGPIELSPEYQPDGRRSSDVVIEMVTLASKGENPRFEWIHLDSERKEIPCEIHLTRLPSDKGYVIRGSLINIEERKIAERKLKESEERFKKVFDEGALGMTMAYLNKIAPFIAVNKAICEMLGYTEEEMLKLTYLNISHPDNKVSDMDVVKQLREGKINVHHAEKKYIKKNGDIIFANRVLSIIHGKNGKPDYSLAMVQDITEKKLAEEKLERKDTEFRKLSANLPDMIFQCTRKPDGTYYVPICSRGIENIFGCTPDEVKDDFEPIARVLYPEDIERVLNEMEYSAKNLTYFTCEFRVQIPGKPIKWIFSRSSPEKLKDGSITWYGFTTNITERKKVEEELARAKAFLQAALDQSTAGIAIADAPDGRLRYVNKAALFIRGGTEKELVNDIDLKNYVESWRLFDLDGVRVLNDDEVPLARAIKYGEINQREYIIRRKFKDDRIVFANAAPIKDEKGEVIAAVVVFIDITERKKVEQELIVAKEKAESADKLKSEFLAQMSHEIRSPINIILNSASYLEETVGETDEEVSSIFSILNSAGNRIIKTIDSIINMSELQLGIYEPHYKKIDLDIEVLNTLCGEYKHYAESKNLQFKYEVEMENPKVIGDQYSISQIFSNLIDNALKPGIFNKEAKYTISYYIRRS